MEPMKVKMTSKEYEKRMKKIKEEENKKLEEEKKANDEFLDSIRKRLLND